MKLSTLTVYLPLIALTAGLLNERAISIAKELHSRDFVPLDRINSSEHGKRDLQHPLLPQETVDSQSTHRSARLEVHSALFWGIIPFYWTNIALGSPNQAFRMIVDLGFGGVLVRAPNCTDPFPGCAGGLVYNHNQSSTYRPEYEHFSLQLQAHTAEGIVGTDHMQLVGLNITDVTFGEVDDFSGENYLYLTMKHYADGAIGLMPPNASLPLYTNSKLPNILHKVVSAGPLESNIMVFDLAPPGSEGSLYLGKVPEEATGNDQIHLPLSHQSSWPLRDSWHTKADSVSVPVNGSITQPMNDTYAVLELSGGLMLPEDAFHVVAKGLRLENHRSPLPSFNCSCWDDMPDVVLSLGGQQVAISVEDYGLRGFMGPDELCVAKIMPTESFPDILVVSLEMLQRKYHIAFDIDKDEVALIERSA